MKIGAQLYTAHDLTKTLEGFSETLKRVADIGYTTVQVSGTCAYEPEWLAEELKKNGLTCGITHTPFDRMVSDTDKVIAEHTTFGCDYIGIGGFFGGVEGMPKFIADATPVAEKMKAAGFSDTDIQMMVKDKLPKDEYPERNQTYHYLPYRFDSNLEKEYFANGLIPLMKDKQLAYYFTGDDPPTEFKIRCSRRVGKH